MAVGLIKERHVHSSKGKDGKKISPIKKWWHSKARKEKLSRLKKSGSVKDATSIFLDMINKQ